MAGTVQAARQSYRGVPAEQRRAERRARLIRAAISIYGQAGFKNSKVKAVCSAAGLTERYFYESFSNAQELLVAAFKTVTTGLQGCILDASRAPTAPGAERVAAILRTWFEALHNDPASARLFLIETTSLGSEVRQALDVEMVRFVDLLEVSWGAHSSGPSLLKLAIAGALLRLATAWVESDYTAKSEELLGAALRISLVLAPTS